MKQKIKKIVKMLSAIFCVITITFTTYSPVIVYAIGIAINGSGLVLDDMEESGQAFNSVVKLSEPRFDGENLGNVVRFGNHIIYDYWIEGSNDLKYADYYCLRGETRVDFSQNYDYRVALTEDTMQDRTVDSIKQEIRDDGNENYIVFKGDNSIKAIQWLVRNMYCVSGNNDDKTKNYMREHLQNIINEFGGSDKVSTTEHISEEIIGVIQQFVVWQFVEHNTGNDSYYYKGLTKDNITTITLTDGSRACATEEQVNEAYAIYTSLLNGAKKYANGETTYSMPVRKNQTIKVTGSEMEYDNSTNTYTVGPININIGDEEALLNLNDSMVITNENNNKVEARNVKYLNENKEVTSDNLKDLAKKNFYVQFTTDETHENLKVKYNVDASFAPSITSLNAYIYLTANKQPLLGSYKIIDTLKRSSGTEFSFEREHRIDLALTKQITTIERDGESVYSSIKRMLGYDFNKLAQNHTTGYNMDKTLITVKPGDEITYKITVYNEGEEAGVVKEITDYLPNGLEFESISTENWSATTENGKVLLKNTQGITVNSVEDVNTTFPNGEAEAYPGGTFFEVVIKCKVSENATSKQILRNIAEITNYGYMAGNDYVQATDNDCDQDSIQANVKIDRYNEVLNELEENDINLDYIDKGIISQEDDDDFEQVIVGEFDLALRKFITTVNGETTINNINLQETRTPKIYTRSALELERKGTALYYHEKTPVSVKKGDEVVYTIRIYNEGYIDGYAKEVIDYLPKGLEYVDDEFNQSYGWDPIQNEDGTTTVTTSYLTNELIPASGGTVGYVQMSLSNSIKYYKDLQIKCRVVDKNAFNGKTLTNVAEISNYGYMDGRNYIQASVTDVDRDSEQNNVFGGNVKDTSMYYNYQDVSPIKNLYRGIQDDDDFESVVVEPFDLALRKFITKVNGNDLEESREPILKTKSAIYLAVYGTAAYFHDKAPVTLKTGDKVLYTIRVYNEGYINGYAKEITDYLPSGLEFLEESQINKTNGWTATKNEDGTTTVKTNSLENSEIKASNGYEHYAEAAMKLLSDEDIFWKDVQIECEVTSTENNKILTNVAEITNYGYMDEENYIEADKQDVDLDSEEDNVFNITQSVTDTEEYFHYQDIYDVNKYEDETVKYIPGIQDDDDFENIKVEYKKPIEGTYDLEILKVDSRDGVTPLKGVTFDVTVKKGDQEVEIYDNDGNKINTKGLTTNEQGKIRISNVKITEEAEYNYEIKEVEVPKGYVLLKDIIKVTFNTTVSDNEYVIDKNVTIDGDAQFKADSNTITITVENGQFDLALRKFITAYTTGVGTEDETKHEITDRIPVFKIDENGNYIYDHKKDPIVVGSQNVVEYTIRVYNEGTVAGYAKEVKDDIPDGLEFLPNDEINKKYGWKMIDEEGNVVEDVNKAKYIVTDFLSKEKEETEGENLLEAFDESAYNDGTVNEPDWRDVKVAFKVTIPDGDDRILINQAQISDDSDEYGDDIVDRDSTPDEWIDGEDDQDTETVRVLEFDLALRKWVTKAIVIENGNETVIDTGHTAEDDPEEIVKVDLKNTDIDKVVVKFEYQIRVTNEGEIAGYAKEISDYIPEGLRFEAADNPQWEEVDGKVVTDQLKDTLLQPGESAEVTIILTWINRADNMGLKVNVAEISKDYNEYGTSDRDSVPDNQVPGEDDIDDAPVMLTVKTGQTTLYITVAVAVLTILASGVALIKKYVLN